MIGQFDLNLQSRMVVDHIQMCLIETEDEGFDLNLQSRRLIDHTQMCLIDIEDEGLNTIGHLCSNLIGWLQVYHCPAFSLAAGRMTD